MFQVAFVSLCDGVAESSLRKLQVHCSGLDDLETAAASLAHAIIQSSLEMVEVWPEWRAMHSALLRTEQSRNLDLVFRQNDTMGILQINRKWKPLLRANVPRGLWARIFAKAQSSSEMSHGPNDIVFFFLKNNVLQR